MPDHTAASAAEYLAERGYTVGRGRIGGRGAPKADTIRRWCERGKVKARRVGYIWLIAQEELDRIISGSEYSHIDSQTDQKVDDRGGGV